MLEVEADKKSVQDVFKSFPDVISFKTDTGANGIIKVSVESKTDLRKEYAKGKWELRSLYRAMKEFLVKLDELYAADS